MVKFRIAILVSLALLLLAACTAPSAPTDNSTSAPVTETFPPVPTNPPPSIAITPTRVPASAPATQPAPNSTSSPLSQTPVNDNATGMHVATLVIQDISTRANVAVSAILITRIEPHDWGDTSLGCAKPGLNYAQVITPGWLIEARVSGANAKTYEYHTDLNGDLIILCRES